MSLDKSRYILDRLICYLYTVNGTGGLDDIKLRVSAKANADNKKNSRFLCHVIKGRRFIYCTEYLSHVHAKAVAGILIHELGHIVLDAFGEDDSEIAVDRWVLNTFPEAEYHYEDTKYERRGRIVTAKSVQSVSYDFLDSLYRTNF